MVLIVELQRLEFSLKPACLLVPVISHYLLVIGPSIYQVTLIKNCNWLEFYILHSDFIRLFFINYNGSYVHKIFLI